MNKYGVDAFIFEVIEECDEHNVDEREKFWIKELNTRDNKHGYNLTEGGSGNSEQTRRKLSEALKGNKHCVGRIASPETRAKLSAHCGHPLSEEHKQKLRKTVRVPNDGFTGHTHTEEARNKIRKARRGSVRSQETKDKISATMKARKKHLDNSTSV